MKHQSITLCLAVSIVMLLACSSKAIAQDSTSSPKTMPGSDRDRHHCIPSAGYIWSTIQNRCVRIWEVGIRLNSLQEVPEGQPVYSLFILFNTDQSKVELFMPGRKRSTILSRRTKADKSCFWSNRDLVLAPGDEPNEYILKDGGEAVYATH